VFLGAAVQLNIWSMLENGRVFLNRFCNFDTLSNLQYKSSTEEVEVFNQAIMKQETLYTTGLYRLHNTENPARAKTLSFSFPSLF
jgi:hypothetical protein